MNKGKPAMCFFTCVKLHLVKRRNRKTKSDAIALCFRPLSGHGCVVESSRAIVFCFPVLVARFDSGITILHGIPPKNTGADHLSSYDATLIDRMRQGDAECDTAIAATPSKNLSLNGTWLDSLTDRYQVEPVIHPYHLAIALPKEKAPAHA